MPIRDILLQLNSYPDRTPSWAIRAAWQIADRFGADLSGAVCHVHIPAMTNFLADRLVGMHGLVAEENAKSRDNARVLLEELQALAKTSGEPPALIDCGPASSPRELAVRARTYDLTIVPAHRQSDLLATVEGLIFESGRPVLLLPEHGAGNAFTRIIIGWDGSRAAARALADALPLLSHAEAVRLVSVVGEKSLDAGSALSDARRHLLTHGIKSETHEIDAGGADAGEALLAYGDESRADLLVMGAYGRSRAREFVLGGATRSVLTDPRLPILLSH
jgi:nucleotide-binding universal stress UspA family protein